MRRSYSISLWLAALLVLAAVGGVVVAAGGAAWVIAYLGVLGFVGWLLGRQIAKNLRGFAFPADGSAGGRAAISSDSHPVREVRELALRLRTAEEEIQRVFQSQRDFTAHAAHELRTPLAALRVAGESALRADRDGAWREAVGGMLEEADRAGRVIDQLLLLARAESGQMEVRLRQYPVSGLIRPVVDLLEPLAHAKGQRIVFRGSEDWSVYCDADLFRLVLENLLSNAIRHSGEGTEIAIQASRWPTGGVAVDVVDDGPGVAPGDEERIFQRFHRGRGVAAEGTGLGLPIARWAADAFGGKVLFERRLGHGSVFRFLCPETEWDHFESNTAPGSHAVREEWARTAPPSQLLVRLATTRGGLSAAQAQERRLQHGENTVRSHREVGPLLRLSKVLLSPFNGVLAVSIALSIALGESGAAVVMATMIVLSTLLRYWQESRAGAAIRSLESLIELHTLVARPEVAAPVTVPVEELVPGDIVHLRPGDMVPADLRLLSADGLQISEATFTGESAAVAKSSAAPRDSDLDGQNICYLGTHVVTGGGVGVVFATGTGTRLGDLAGRAERRYPPGPFEHGVRRVSLALLGFMAALVPLVFFINGALKGNWTEALLFGLAAAIGLTPELLPMIVNVNLARAATALSRRGVIVRSLPAIQELGSMDVLCVDKTGTLTEDRPRLVEAVDAQGRPDRTVLECALVNSTLQKSTRGPLDDAVLLRGTAELPGLRTPPDLLCELAFDHERRRVSVIVRQPGRSSGVLHCKGAAEAVLEACGTRASGEDGCSIPIDQAFRDSIGRRLRQFHARGLRVLGVASRAVEPADFESPAAELERDMVLCGFLLFDDPLREEARKGIAALRAGGVRICMLTGDHLEAALPVALQVGISGKNALTGAEVSALSTDELARRVKDADLFARLTPLEKARVVEALRQHDRHRVGFVGDGANDANALREADVGIVAGEAADLARECADVVLAHRGLGILAEAVQEGRTAFGNILKYIKITASSNLGNAVSVVLASLLLPFLPMRAVQLLVQNLLYDLTQFFLPWDRVDAEFRRHPRGWSADSIVRFMLVFGPVSCIFDLLTFAVLWWGLGAQTADQAALFHTGWFTVGLLTQLLIVHVLRTGQSVVQSPPATGPVFLATFVAAAVGLVLPHTPIAPLLGFDLLPAWFFAWVIFVLLAYATTAEVVKRWYVRKTGQWL